MKPLLLLLTYAIARPGYHYEFPRDHFSHPAFQTEWWYFTGNLWDQGGRRFGFELTFFRSATTENRTAANVWDPPDVWLAHLTLSDIEGGKFYHYERLNRAGPGLAGASLEQGRIWNGNWQARLDRLQAVAETFEFDLALRSDKPPVIHGENGVSQKAAGEGHASHYVSFTRLETTGKLKYAGREFQVRGTTWMDHEFFTNVLGADQTGWDWFSVQLDSREELMVGRLRRKDGSIDRVFHGTYIDASGKARTLRSEEIQFTPGETWQSPTTGARYPVAWRIEIPTLALDLRLTTPLQKQELTGKAAGAYWEGAVDYQGTARGKAVKGVGYLEMTGYAGAVKMSGRN